MFKILGNRQEAPGFEDPILIVSNSQHCLIVDDDGHQIPPCGIAAVDSEIATSTIVANLVANGSAVLVGDTSKLKKKKKAESDVVVSEIVKPAVVAEVKPETVPAKEEPKLDTVSNLSKSKDETIVAQSVDEKQVSSNKNIVNPN